MGPTMSKDLRPPAALAMAFGAVDTGSMKERLAFDQLGQGDDGNDSEIRMKRMIVKMNGSHREGGRKQEVQRVQLKKCVANQS